MFLSYSVSHPQLHWTLYHPILHICSSIYLTPSTSCAFLSSDHEANKQSVWKNRKVVLLMGNQRPLNRQSMILLLCVPPRPFLHHSVGNVMTLVLLHYKNPPFCSVNTPPLLWTAIAMRTVIWQIKSQVGEIWFNYYVIMFIVQNIMNDCAEVVGGGIMIIVERRGAGRE